MLKALVMMKGREQFEFNSRTYENFRIEFGKRQSEWMIKNNPMKGKKLSNKRRNEISIRRKEYLSNKENHPFFGKNHKEESNIKNRESNSLRIKIFDNNGELKFECNVGLEIFCKENDLPFKVFKKSYQTNGQYRLYEKYGECRVSPPRNKNWIQYTGWYAIAEGYVNKNDGRNFEYIKQNT